MSWIDLLDNNHFLKTLYPVAPPILEAVRLHEVLLHQDGPAVSLRFDLHEYPVKPPAKWDAAKGNTVQVRLVGIGVQRIDAYLAKNINDFDHIGRAFASPSEA